MSLADIAL